MMQLAFVVGVAIAIAAAFAPERWNVWLYWMTAFALACGLAGFAFLGLAPKDFLTRWPWLVPLLHPYRLALLSALSAMLSLSVCAGLLARRIVRRGKKRF